MYFPVVRHSLAQTLIALLIMGLAGFAPFVAAQPAETATSRSTTVSTTALEQRLRNELRMLLLDMVQSGELDGTGAPLSLLVESTREHSAELGVLVDTRNGVAAKSGLLVLGTTPGGLASRIGFRNGDRIVSLNEVSLVGLGSADDGSARAGRVLRETLAAAEESSQLVFGVLREGENVRLQGVKHSVLIPAFSLRVGALDSRSGERSETDDRHAPAEGCGWISTFDNAPRQQHLHGAVLISIDDTHAPLGSSNRYRVSAGRHVLKVGELIDHRYLGFSTSFRDRGAGDRYKTLEIEVAPNTSYSLAARVNQEYRNEWRDGKFWDPVIWTSRQENCK